MRSAVLAICLFAAVAPGAAAEPAPACATVSDANLPADFAAWARPGDPLAATRTAAAAPELSPGAAQTISLNPAASVQLASPAGKLRTTDNAHAGLLKLRIPSAGTWRVSASTPVWIDIVAPAGPVASSGHGQMAPCTTIRKVVEFPLPAGDYLLQLTANPGPDLRLMVSPKP